LARGICFGGGGAQLKALTDYAYTPADAGFIANGLCCGRLVVNLRPIIGPGRDGGDGFGYQFVDAFVSFASGFSLALSLKKPCRQGSFVVQSDKARESPAAV
jgi:hypothetical protein